MNSYLINIVASIVEQCVDIEGAKQIFLSGEELSFSTHR